MGKLAGKRCAGKHLPPPCDWVKQKQFGACAAKPAGKHWHPAPIFCFLPLGREQGYSKTPNRQDTGAPAAKGQGSYRDGENPGRETRPWKSMQVTLIVEFQAHLLCRKHGCQQG